MKILLDIYLEKNLGDDLFLVSILKRYPTHQFYIFTQLDYSEVSRQYSNIHFIKLNKYFNYFLAKSNQKAVYKKVFIKKHAIDAIAVIGGSIFIEYEGWEKLYQERLSLWKYMHERGQKVFVIGSNYGPYQTKEFINKYEQAFNYVEDICFRDRYSYELFDQLENVRQEADVIMSFDIAEYDKGIHEPSIGISIINLKDRKNLAPHAEAYQEKMVEIINDATKKGKRVYLMSFCEREGDEEAIEGIASRITERKEQIEPLYYRGDIHAFLHKFGKIDEIIACRFHSIILSVLFEKPSYFLIYSEKSSYFIQDSKLPTEMKRLEDLSSLSPQDLEKAFRVSNDIDNLVLSGEKQFKALDMFLTV